MHCTCYSIVRCADRDSSDLLAFAFRTAADPDEIDRKGGHVAGAVAAHRSPTVVAAVATIPLRPLAHFFLTCPTGITAAFLPSWQCHRGASCDKQYSPRCPPEASQRRGESSLRVHFFTPLQSLSVLDAQHGHPFVPVSCGIPPESVTSSNASLTPALATVLHPLAPGSTCHLSQDARAARTLHSQLGQIMLHPKNNKADLRNTS